MPATIAVVQPKGLNAVNVKVDGGPRTVIQAKGAITDPTVDSGPEIIESSNEPSNPTIKDDLVMGSVIQEKGKQPEDAGPQRKGRFWAWLKYIWGELKYYDDPTNSG